MKERGCATHHITSHHITSSGDNCKCLLPFPSLPSPPLDKSLIYQQSQNSDHKYPSSFNYVPRTGINTNTPLAQSNHFPSNAIPSHPAQTQLTHPPSSYNYIGLFLVGSEPLSVSSLLDGKIRKSALPSSLSSHPILTHSYQLQAGIVVVENE
jgi:hypothetical protein